MIGQKEVSTAYKHRCNLVNITLREVFNGDSFVNKINKQQESMFSNQSTATLCLKIFANRSNHDKKTVNAFTP